MANESVEDGLTGQQLQDLKNYLPGIISVDFFLDRQIVVALRKHSYSKSIRKVGGRTFWAWGCVVILVLLGDNQRMDFICKIKGGYMPPEKEPQPGSNVFNDNGEFSTLGIFLIKDTGIPATNTRVENITVSAHSFLKKVSVDIVFNWPCGVVLALVTHIAYVSTKDNLISILVLKQLLLVRLFIVIHDCYWKYLGKYVGLHSLVLLFIDIF